MPANHKAKSDLIDIFEKYYPKICIAGLMMGPALFGEDLQQFGHNVGMVVLKQLQQNAAMSNGTVTTIRDVLKVLAACCLLTVAARSIGRAPAWCLLDLLFKKIVI